MQRALRAGWPCAWPMVSSLCGYDPAREKAPDAPLLALGLLMTLSCQGRAPLASPAIGGRGGQMDRPPAPSRTSPAVLIRLLCHYDRVERRGPHASYPRPCPCGSLVARGACVRRRKRARHLSMRHVRWKLLVPDSARRGAPREERPDGQPAASVRACPRYPDGRRQRRPCPLRRSGAGRGQLRNRRHTASRACARADQARRAFLPARLYGARDARQIRLLPAAGRDGGGDLWRLRARHGRHAAEVPLPGELRAPWRPLRPLHRDHVSERAAGERKPRALPGRRGQALLQDAPGWAERLLLPDLRQALEPAQEAATVTVDLRSSLFQPTSGPNRAASPALMTM